MNLLHNKAWILQWFSEIQRLPANNIIDFQVDSWGNYATGALDQASVDRENLRRTSSMISSEQEAAIRQAAYHKWEQAGRPIGDGLEFWLESEQELLGPHRYEPATEVQDLGPEPEPEEPVLVGSSVSGINLHTDDGQPSEEFHQEARTNRRSRRRT